MNDYRPDQLGEAGARLWDETVEHFELTSAESLLLESAAREADLVKEIEASWRAEGSPMTARGSQGQVVAHPALQELRQHRNALRQLLVSLKLPGEGEAPGGVLRPMSRSEVGKVAARARWGTRGSA